jgi:hypothetical protein
MESFLLLPLQDETWNYSFSMRTKKIGEKLGQKESSARGNKVSETISPI